MLVPFLIMLREGLEAALIVGIVANYLHHTGRRALLPAVVLGILLAVAVSLLAGAGLQWAAAEFPQKQQELFEALVSLVAVGVLTGMVFWMRKAASAVRQGLEASVETAVGRGLGGWALVGVVFLAVAREGLESIFFLLAIFQQSQDWRAPLGALAGIALSVLLGWGLYQGGLRLNLRRFFRYTGLFVLLVAAGLLAGALRKLHEAGIWNIGQQVVFDSSDWLPMDGPVGVILSGLLGYQSTPVVSEAVVYVLYLVVVLFLFLRPVRPVASGTPAAVAGTGAGAQAAAVPHAVAVTSPHAGTQRHWRGLIAVAAVLVLASGFAFQYATSTLHRRAATPSGTQVTITIAGRECVPNEVQVPAGLTTFTVINQTSRALEWEILDGVMVVDERENIAPGFTQTLRTRLRPGTFEMTCGLLSNPRGRLVVQPSDASRAAAAKPALVQYVGLLAEYQVYQRMALRSSQRDLEAARTALAAGDADAAQSAIVAARTAYARLRLLAPTFADADAQLEPAAANAGYGFAALLRLLATGADDVQEPLAALEERLAALATQLAGRQTAPASLVLGAARYLDAQAVALESGQDDAVPAWAVLLGAEEGTRRIVSLLTPLLVEAAPISNAALSQALDAWQAGMCAETGCGAVRAGQPAAQDRPELAVLMRTVALQLRQTAADLGLEEQP